MNLRHFTDEDLNSGQRELRIYSLLISKLTNECANVWQNLHPELIPSFQTQFGFHENAYACWRAGDDDSAGLKRCSLRKMGDQFGNTEYQVIDATILDDLPVMQPSNM